jgi:hypothetical protein
VRHAELGRRSVDHLAVHTVGQLSWKFQADIILNRAIRKLRYTIKDILL